MQQEPQRSNVEIELASTMTTALADYYEHLRRRINRMAEALPSDKFWERPFAFGNSFGSLVVHVTGSLNHFVGAKIVENGYVRDRDKEFEILESQSAYDVMSQFNIAVQQAVMVIHSHTASELMMSVDFSDEPVKNRTGLFIVSAGHLNNHIGQMAYLLHAQGVHLDEQTW